MAVGVATYHPGKRVDKHGQVPVGRLGILEVVRHGHQTRLRGPLQIPGYRVIELLQKLSVNDVPDLKHAALPGSTTRPRIVRLSKEAILGAKAESVIQAGQRHRMQATTRTEIPYFGTA